MKKTCRSIIFIFLLFSLIYLSGCVNKETQNVISLIDSIGEVTIDSKYDIDSAIDAYNSLEEKDKERVKNIEKLHEAEEAFEEFIPEYVSQEVYDYRFSDFINYIELKKFVSEYHEYFNEDQEKIIGCAIGKCKIKDLVISTVKKGMKNPNSFELVSFDPGYITKDADGNYSSFIKITYRGTNSFGGVVSDSLHGLIEFSVNFADCSITYKSDIFI